VHAKQYATNLMLGDKKDSSYKLTDENGKNISGIVCGMLED
jgi:hypothetical protein